MRATTMYRERSPRVEAYQFSINDPFPLFLHAAMMLGSIWYQGGEKPYLTLNVGDGSTVRAYVGDWIFRSVDASEFSLPDPKFGPFQVLSDEAFRRRYHPEAA